MNHREARLLLLVMALGLSLAFVIAPRTQGQRNKRHTCRQDCASKYEECLGKENADAAECEKALDDCRGECVGSKPKPESEHAADAKPAPEGRAAEKATAAAAETNANDSTNVNGNTNANTNDNLNSSSGGTTTPPPAPKKMNSNQPSAAHR